jgi:hypothetical protein
MIIYLSNTAESNGQQVDGGTLIEFARFYPLGEIIAELNRVPGALCERKRMRGLPFERGWPGGFNCPGCGDGRGWLRRAEALPTHFACNL